MFFLPAFGTADGFIPLAFSAVKFLWLPALPALREGEVWISTKTWKPSWCGSEGRVLVFQALFCPEWILTLVYCTVCVVLQSENPAMEGQNFSFLFDLDWCDRFPGGSDGKATSCNAGDLGSILGSGRSLGEGNGNPLQYSCPENSMDRGAWRAAVYCAAKSRTQLSD